jgi:hypothetical protein
MLVSAFVVSAALTLSTASPRPAATRRASPAAAVTLRRGAERPPATPLGAPELYSLRARRRFASYLRMRLLELRAEGLERAADVIQRRLPVDTLLRP